MQEVVLGRTALRVSRLGLGTAPMASVFWGNEETIAIDAARRALDAGVTFVDTAPLYGLGEAEHRLGAALRAGRFGVVIATKVGRLLEVGPDGEIAARFDFGYDAVRRSLESSLGRLGVDRVDIVHIHDPDDHVDDAVAGAHRALVDLREQGVIEAVSVGTGSAETAATFLERCDLDCMLVAGRYTLLDQTAAPVIQQCAERGIAYLAAGVFNSGVLARPSEDAWYDYAPATGPMLERVRRIERLCRRYDVSLRTAALSFVLAHPKVTAVIVGMATPEEVDDNLAAASVGVPEDLWIELRESSLLVTTTTEEGSA
jgi:D-threo-aldose 1-dehydrogenase